MTASATDQKLEVVICGAGGVGLFLGCCLHRLGIRFSILERRTDVRMLNRSIGIHPPALELFDRLGLADQFLARGVKVRLGQAYSGTRPLGAISFAGCPPPHQYVLTLPQSETENIMENHLHKVAPGCLQRGVTLEKIELQHDGVKITAQGADAPDLISCRFLAGCDGKTSQVRRQLGIPFDSKVYEDTFVMGDVKDNTGIGDEARIYLDESGFIETFPLPGGVRRWVMRTPAFQPDPDEKDFSTVVKHRTDFEIGGCLISPLAPFRVERYLASKFAKGRVVLAGDAAHLMSPIGGQGMNVGWMDAWDAAGVIQRVLREDADADRLLRDYDQKARARAERAIHRAEFYMAVGRNSSFNWRRFFLLKFALGPPVRDRTAKFFTMRYL